MNTFQLAQFLTKDPFTKRSFAGVYACNQLSSTEINEYPRLFVVNTDPMELPGTHWIMIYFNPNQYGGGHYGPPIVFPQYLRNNLSLDHQTF